MTCWDVLGLSSDADSRTIKRQYATLLKKTRPDDDAEGFQRLREAYESALNWSQREQEPEVFDVLVENVAEPLAQRYQAAQSNGSALYFEIELLQRCIQGELSAEDRQWAFETFNWLTAWQRLELPGELVEALEQQHRTALQQPLRLALEQKDEAGFLAAYAARADHSWVNNHPHAAWFNQWLAKLLAHSHYWSGTVFDAVCAGQDWHGGSGHGCPAGEWAILLRRQQAPIFMARQRALAAEPPYSPQQRAARLLLAPMSLCQRRAFAQRLDAQDWKACHALSVEIYADHVAEAEAMPGGTVYFWQGWDKGMDTWPWVIAILLSCLLGTLMQATTLSGNLLPSLGHGLLWSLAYVVGAGLAWQAWRPLAHQYRVLDEQLSRRLPRRISPTHLPLLPIRELVPGAVIAAALGYVLGPFASLTLIAVLAAIGVVKRPFMNSHTPWAVRHPRWAKVALVGYLVMGVALYTGLKLLDDQHRVTRNQGLQQWTERLCSRMPRTDVECQAPATQAQWYGQEVKP
ncbi:J domain-containing protein [Pseudomonas sp. 1152_12]|uniref:J domain-containing protein n=1 Tax=Pseudomonas sp. 1152_12 TaxID=2604455 RepID=UPI00406406EF